MFSRTNSPDFSCADLCLCSARAKINVLFVPQVFLTSGRLFAIDISSGRDNFSSSPTTSLPLFAGGAKEWEPSSSDPYLRN